MTHRGPVDWVVFDLGETLVDETENWNRWADHLDVPRLTFFALLGAMIADRRPHTDVFEMFQPDFDFARESARKAASGSPWHITASDLYPDAISTLTQLRLDGYQVAVMANQPLEAVPFLRTLPVDLTATSAEWEVAKPDTAFFQRVCRAVGVEPNRIAYVGDRVDNDVLPSRQAGMLAVHVKRGPWGHIQSRWPEAEEADLRVDSLAELSVAFGAG